MSDGHIYQGSCPDEVTGPGSRDPACQACIDMDDPKGNEGRLRAEIARLQRELAAAQAQEGGAPEGRTHG